MRCATPRAPRIASGRPVQPAKRGPFYIPIRGPNSLPIDNRAGIENVPGGQWEASLTLGLPVRRAWLGIILPQAARAVLPMLGSVGIGMFKETAVLSTITVFELLAHAVDIGSMYFRYIEPLTMVGFFYFIVSYSLARLVRRMEARSAAGI